MDQAIRRLKALYALYDQVAAACDKACRPGCAACCTRNVVITSLEGRLILDYLDSTRQASLLDRIAGIADQPCFRPSVTINQIAALCLEDRDPPDEEADPATGTCPLLRRDTCPIYEVRPFGCRSMMSMSPCAAGSAADMPEWLLSVNTLFMQHIEALDAGNLSGNLIDILLYLRDTEHAEAAAGPGTLGAGGRDTGPARLGRSHFLLRNRPIPVLMVPPEYRASTASVLNSIRQALH